jgi:phosphoglycerate kinase
MCYTFLAAHGYGVGDSLLERDQIGTCRKLLESGKIVLPSDVVVADEFSAEANTRTVAVDAIPDGWKGLDIGPEATTKFCGVVSKAGTVFWNGPMGLFEDDRFASGTVALAQAVADAHGFMIVGGGDSAAALAKFGLHADVDHVSTGGGASLELIEQGDLPGLVALRKASNAS